ncbi:MAG: YHYH protein [Chitinophagales bacterium]
MKKLPFFPKVIAALLIAGILIASAAQTYRISQHHQQSAIGQITGDNYLIHLDSEECQVNIQSKLQEKSLFEEQIDESQGKRIIHINSIPSHSVGEFPNQGNPNTIQEREWTFSIPLHPKIAEQTTGGQGFDTGVLFSGVSIDPFTGEFFIGSNGMSNREWNITTFSSLIDLGLDCNNAHVQPTGKYHYHGTPSAYLQELGADGSEMVKVGYAADGFPIYYKYGYNENGKLAAYESGYQLRKGKRSGDGKTAPDGNFNGMYFNDYEYIATLSDLDACNGKWGKTPESQKEYHYIITDNFPSVPICFSGTPSQELHKHGGLFRGGNNHPPHSPKGRGHHHPHRH